MSEPLKLGFCNICNDTEIWVKERGRVRKTAYYAEFSFVLSNNVVYRHGICSKCIVDLDEEKVEALIDRIRVNWKTELGQNNQAGKERIKSTKLSTFAINEKEALELHEVKVEQARLKMLADKKKEKKK